MPWWLRVNSSALTEAVDGEVRFDAGSRDAYAHDGSNYRQPPIGDGFSCRTQLAAGHTGREGWHLAQLLARVTQAEDSKQGSASST